MKIFAIAALSVLLTACAGTTARIEPAKLNEAQKGVTTVAEITRQFGRPSVLSKNPDGTQTAVYIYNDPQATGTAMVTLLANESRDSVTFNFDTKGLLTDVKTTEANRKPAATEPAKSAPTASTQPAVTGTAPAATGSTQPATSAQTAAKPATSNTNSNKWSLPGWLPSPTIENR